MSGWFRIASLWIAGIALAGATTQAQDLKASSRMTILRGLVAEYGTVLAPLPRGEKGLFLRVDSGIDQDSLLHETTHEGTAIPPKTLVQITQITFHDKEIVFEINGGGKKKTKWYEHVEIGVGNNTTPISNPNGSNVTATGSTITLVFPKKLPDLTVDELKDYLSPVLDFEARNPIQMIAEPVPPEFQKAIEEKQAVVGMTGDMVRAALGPPDQKVREEKDGVEQEDWIYGAPPLKVTFVTFEEDKVVRVEEASGGVRGQTASYPTEPPR
jgi:hypothetical protein